METNKVTNIKEIISDNKQGVVSKFIANKKRGFISNADKDTIKVMVKEFYEQDCKTESIEIDKPELIQVDVKEQVDEPGVVDQKAREERGTKVVFHSSFGDFPLNTPVTVNDITLESIPDIYYSLVK